MKQFNQTQLKLAWMPGMLQPPHNSLTLIVKGCFDFADGEQASFSPDEDLSMPTGDLFVEENELASLSYANDFVVYKPKADLTLSGVAYPQAGKGGCRVSFSVGQWQKSLAIFNDRFWHWGSASKPEPFSSQTRESIPLTYENAYGGEETKNNPVGKGAKEQTLQDGTTVHPLPNIEHIGDFVTSPSQKAKPAGYGPLKNGWGDRTELKGTYDDKWLKDVFPGFPSDFDWGFFNCAPKDQQVDFLRGDESLSFENLRPEHPSVNSHLPAVRPRLFIKGQYEQQEIFQEITLRLDTLHVDMEKQQLHLVWRGVVAVSSDEYEELDHACLFHEKMDQALLSASHYQQLFQQEMAKNEPAFEAEDFEDEQGQDVAIAQVTTETASGLMPGESVQETASSLDKELGNILDKLKSQLKHAGWEDEYLDLISPDMDENVFSHKVFENYDISAKAGEDYIAKLQSEQDKFLAAHGQDVSVASALNKAPEHTEPAIEEQAPAIKPLEKELADGNLEEADLVGMDLSHLDLSNMNFKGADLTRANLTGSVLTGADFSEADLSHTNLQKVNAQGAIFDQAIFDGADATFGDFSNASFNQAQCQQASFIKAELSGACLNNADFSNGVVPGAKFIATQMRETLFEGADLAQAQIENASAIGCDFSKTNLREAIFVDCDLRSALFVDARLTLASFEQCELSEAVLEQVDATSIHFNQCQLNGTRAGEASRFTNARFIGGSAQGAIFEGDELANALFSGLTLQSADFSGCNLVHAVFEQCDMKLVDFKKADISDAKLSGINLFQASFAKAKLIRTDLSASNLFGVEFRQANVDDVNLNKAIIHRTEIEAGMLK